MKILFGYCVGMGTTLCVGLFFIQLQKGDYQKELEKRDSVNNKNIEINAQLKEQIRLDSLSFHEQLYPKK